MLGKINLEIVLEKIGQRVLDEDVGNGLLRLVLVGGLRGKAVDDEDEAVLDVGKADLALIFLVCAHRLEILVRRIDKRGAHRLIGRAAVLEKAGIVVVFDAVDRIREAEGHLGAQLVVVLVLAVAAAAFQRPEHRLGQRRAVCNLADIVGDAVFVDKFLGVKAAVRVFIVQDEFQPLVDDRLALERPLEKVARDGDVGEDVKVGPPADDGAALFAPLLQRMRFQLACGFALGKPDGMHLAAVIGADLHKFGGILRGAGAEAVEPERIAVGRALVVVVVFAARVQLAVDQLPVVAPLALVVPERDAAAEVLDLQGVVAPDRDDDLAAVAFARLVHRVGQDLKKRMLAALKPVRAEDDRRALAHAVRALQHGDALVIVCGGILIVLCHIASESPVYGTSCVLSLY